jgi:immune inhibitor A
MIKILSLLFGLIITIQTALAVPLAPEIVEMLRHSGQLDQIVQADRAARAKGVWQANPDPIRLGLTTDIDTLYCIIVLADFDDMPYTDGSLAAEPEDFDSLLFSERLYQPGSMSDYYFETSYGQALLLGQVTQWYRMPELSTYYADGQRGFGDYPRNAQRLAEDAVLAADPDIDFSPYDNDHDGMVDGLFVVHAGPGYENTGNLNHIHSHAWVTNGHINTNDSVYVYSYSMEPEENGGIGMVNIGVFCHEFGHVLGLPDLYDYGYDSQGVGFWSIMAGGVWADGGRTPVHFDAWCKLRLGFVYPQDIYENLSNEQIDAVEFAPDIYRLFSLGDPFFQYFLVENRQRTLFDSYLPGDGLLIYHVDETQNNNDNQDRYLVAVEQADGEFDLEHNNSADPGDPWPGLSNNRIFDDFSIPNAWLYLYGPSEVSVAYISDSDSIMHADLYIMYDSPLYELLSLQFDDSYNGNNNGRPEAGETCNLLFTARNIRAGAENLTVTVTVSDPGITFSDPMTSFGNLPINTPFNNQSDPITFSIPDDFPSNFVIFTLTFSANSGGYQQEFTRRLVIGTPDVLLVDDDSGDNLETYLTDALDFHNLLYEIWDIFTQGSPADNLNSYPIVIWFTGDTRTEAMPLEDVNGLINYLDNNGRLLMTSQDFVQRLTERGTTEDMLLLNSYLKVNYTGRTTSHAVIGETETEFEGLRFLTGGNEGPNNQSSQDVLDVLGDGLVLARYSSMDAPAMVGVRDGYSALTAGFGAEGINSNYPGYDDRAIFIAAAFQFLYSPTNIDGADAPLSRATILNQNYPNPFNAQTVISYSLDKQSDVKIEIFDILGRSIETLTDKLMPAGIYRLVWDANAVPSGIYFYKITAGAIIETKKMMLLK